MVLKIIYTLLILSGLRCWANITETLSDELKKSPYSDSYKLENSELINKLGEKAFHWDINIPSEKMDSSVFIQKTPFPIYKPNQIIKAQRQNSNYLVYDKIYSIDEHSRRKTKIAIQKQENLLMLGCSFTFGTGLNDEDTLPYLLASKRSFQNVYNFGIYGAGANDILEDLDQKIRYRDISNQGGIAIYTALYDHIERTLCVRNCYEHTYRDWVLPKTSYIYDKHSKSIKAVGSFENSRPIENIFLNSSFFRKSLNYFNSIITGSNQFRYSPKQLEDYVLIVKKIKEELKKNWNIELYFTFYFGNYQQWDEVEPLLIKHQIKYLDMSLVNIEKITNLRHSIILDGHPSAVANYVFASYLDKSLPKQSKVQ